MAEGTNRSTRWFIVRTQDDFFTFSSRDNVIVWIQDHVTEWLGKTLEEIKVMILEKKGKVIELKSTGEEKDFLHFVNKIMNQ